MNARTVVAAVVVLALSLSSLGTVQASGDHDVSCGSGVGASVTGEIGAEVRPGDDCGVVYDSDDGEVTVSVTFDEIHLDSWSYPSSIVTAIPSHVDLDDGIAHPLQDFLDELDKAFEALGPAANGQNADTWADAEGVHIATADEQADVPWPRDPIHDRKLIDHQRVHVPSSYQASSSDVVAFLDEHCRQAGGAHPCVADLVDHLPVDLPGVTAVVGVADAGTDGFGMFVRVDAGGGGATTARSPVAGPSTEVRPSAAVTWDADRRPGETASGSADEPAPVPGDPVPTSLAAVAILAAFGGVAGYRRLRDGEILDHSLRHRIYDYILDNPGATVQELSDALDVDYSTAKHHASVLHDFDLIHRRQEGRVSHYFENHGTYDPFEKEAIPLLRDGTGAEVARVVRENPKITPSAVARKLEIDPSTVKWHVDKLQGAQLVEKEPLDGRSVGLEVPETAHEVVDRWV